MSRACSSAGTRFRPECRVIEVRVAELRQLFNAIDPSPFRDRDLDSRAEQFIVEWAREFPRAARLALLVHLERSAGQTDEAPLLGESIHHYFRQRAVDARRRLRELFRRGRISLVIALAFLGALIVVGDAVAPSLRDTGFSDVIHEGLLIVGWVAMWRPLEVFLYDWWPIRAEARLFDRLSTMPVRIEYQETCVHRRLASRLAGRVGVRAATLSGARRSPRWNGREASNVVRRHGTSAHPRGRTRDSRSGPRSDDRRILPRERSAVIESESRLPCGTRASATTRREQDTAGRDV